MTPDFDSTRHAVKNPPLQTAIKEYLRYLGTERRYSKFTIRNYQRTLVQFMDFCVAQSVCDWNEVIATHVRAFVSQQHRKGLTGRSLQGQLSSIRSFYNYQLKLGFVNQNPAKGISAPRGVRHLPETLTPDELDKLLSIECTNEMDYRDKAMMELLYGCGLRVSELVGLNWSDIDSTEALLRVIGKGNKQRTVPVGKKASDALNQWRLHRTARGENENIVFIGKRGQRINPGVVRACVSRRAKAKAMGCHVYPHMFRHSYASHLLESSRDIRAVQELLGHANLSTTQIYTHLDFQHLAGEYDKAHPRARKKG